jgi:hypothetical protein
MLMTGRPAYLPHQLTGNHHRDFFSNVLPKVLEDVPLTAKARKGCTHVGAPHIFVVLLYMSSITPNMTDG